MKFLAFILGVWVLASCGGDDRSITPITQTPLATREFQVSIDPSVPKQAKQSVLSIISSLDNAELGSTLKVPGLDNTETLIIGIDAKQRLILAGFFTSPHAALSIDTTAQTLVRIAADLVIPPTGVAIETIVEAIINSPHYSTLTAVITTELAAQQVPTDSSIVVEVVWQVANDVISALATPAGSQLNVVRKNALTAIGNAEALPFYFWNNGASDKTWLTDDAGTQNIKFNNRTFLAWRVTTDSGSKYISQPMSNGIAQLLGYYGNSESITSVVGPALDEKLVITVDQDQDTIRQNFTSLTSKYIFGMIAIATEGLGMAQSDLEKCAIKISNTFVGGSEFNSLVGNPTYSEFSKFIGIVADKIGIKMIAGCGMQTDITSILDSSFKIANAELFIALNTTKIVYQFSAISWQVFNRQATPISVQICKKQGIFVSCGDNYNISPSNPSISVMETIQLIVSVTDKNGNMLTIPPNLQFTSTDPSVATVDSTGLVIGKAKGTTIITLTNPASDKLAQVNLIVTDTTCQQTYAGQYSGLVSEGGPINFNLTPQTGSTLVFNITGTAEIGGKNIPISGIAQPPNINGNFICANSAGNTFICGTASGTLINGIVSMNYSTVTNESGTFSMNKFCP